MTPKFKLKRDFCTVHLATKFYHLMFHCLEVIMQTNKLADAAENIHLISLYYAGLVGNDQIACAYCEHTCKMFQQR